MWKKNRTEGEKLQNEEINEFDSLEGKLEEIEHLVEKLEKERSERIKKKESLEMKEREKRKKKSERLEIKKKLEESWAMLRWAMQHIEENQEQWKLDKEERQEDKQGEILKVEIPKNNETETNYDDNCETWRPEEILSEAKLRDENQPDDEVSELVVTKF